jgi:hypothetical protein
LAGHENGFSTIARAPAIEQVLPVQGTPTNVAEVRSSSQKEELDGNIFFP